MENWEGEGLEAPLGPAGDDETPEANISRSPETCLSTETPQKTLDGLRAEALDGEKVGARKLTFREQCGAFAALYAGVRNQVVARAFGVSLQCASKISGCLEYDPDPYREAEGGEKVLLDHNRNRSPARHRHYETVAREFEALGAEEFNRRYYGERTVKRILAAKEQLRVEGEAKRKSEARAARGLGSGQ